MTKRFTHSEEVFNYIKQFIKDKDSFPSIKEISEGLEMSRYVVGSKLGFLKKKDILEETIKITV